MVGAPNSSMARETHCDELRNVSEDDRITAHMSDGTTRRMMCQGRQTEHADPRSGEVRETTIWQFDAIERQPAVSITDGLRSSEDDPEFPQHSEMWDIVAEENLGYIEEIEYRKP